MAESSEAFVSAHVVARHLDLDYKTLEVWRFKGEGPPFYKFGRSVRYRLSEVDAWAESQCVR